MNFRQRIILLLLGMTTFMPGNSVAYHASDSTLLYRIWSYQGHDTAFAKAIETNAYIRYHFQMDHRNALLFLVPTMYVIAQGDRNYIGESYGRVSFHDFGKRQFRRQVVCGNIPRQRTAMPVLMDFSTPNLYGVTLFPDHLLSPFHFSNRRLYHYTTFPREPGRSVVQFRPRTYNTQLVSGEGVVDTQTGHLISVQFEGEFDMISFKVQAEMNQQDYSPIPQRCSTEATFNFLGNSVLAAVNTVYGCPETLPDSIQEKRDKALMDTLRPIPLTDTEKSIYQKQEDRQRAALPPRYKSPHEHNWLKEIGWDLIGDNLLNGHKAKMGNVSMRVSPLLNPLYFGYSPSRGIGYKLKFGLQYSWNSHRFLTFNPHVGYNFKKRQFYYNAPIRMNYNPKRNGYTEIAWANGNRISNTALAEDFKQQMGDSITMPEYEDEYVQIVNNVVAFKWLEVTTGMVYHRRHSTNRLLMRDAGIKDVFRSLSPMMTLRLSPWAKGPTLTANYEVGLNDVLHSNLKYQRWEFDAAYLRRMQSLRILNIRLGTGFYTQRSSHYFVDYTNFRDNNLPTGWEDDWSGQFQLLSSHKYNASDYYLRGHISYDSPLLAVSHLPLVGRYLETERIYLSALTIQHTRPYFEVGYGFSNRLFSTGIFASFLNISFQDFGCKFTIELFRRW